MGTPQSKQKRRILIVGKTGCGKSSTANTILGARVFEAKMCGEAVTKRCQYQRASISGYDLLVVDTPGFVDPDKDTVEIQIELLRICSVLAPGFHAIIFVVAPGRDTKENRTVPNLFIETFGEGVLRYSIVLVTHLDILLKEGTVVSNGSLDRVFAGFGPELKDLKSKVDDRVIAFDNNSGSKAQVYHLMKMVDTIVKNNNNQFFKNGIFDMIEDFASREGQSEISEGSVCNSSDIDNDPGVENQNLSQSVYNSSDSDTDTFWESFRRRIVNNEKFFKRLVAFSGIAYGLTTVSVLTCLYVAKDATSEVGNNAASCCLYTT